VSSPELSWAIERVARRMEAEVDSSAPMLCEDAIAMTREMETAIMAVPCINCGCPFRCHAASSPFPPNDPRRKNRKPCNGPVTTTCNCKGWKDPVATLPGMAP
jgi:hypothetical protein